MSESYGKIKICVGTSDKKDLEEITEQALTIPAVYGSIEEAVNELKLDKRVKWKVWNNELCRYTKKSICPEYVVKNGTPVQINCR
jgi:hypothetical protein